MICDLIYNKGPLQVKHLWCELSKGQLLKHFQKSLYAYNCYICTIVHGNCMYVYKTVVEVF